MNFDRLAPFYRTLEAIAAGNQLQRCRTAFLDEISIPRRVLIAGEGHGRFLPELLRRFPDASITVVDSSKAMLEIAQSRASAPAVEFIHADLCEWLPTMGDFDLIVTHFFLDCFPPERLATLTARLAGFASPAATWLIADFQNPHTGSSSVSSRITRLRSRLILAVLYRFFRATCAIDARFLTPPDTFLLAAGFSLKHRISRDWNLLHSDLWTRDNSPDGRHDNCRMWCLNEMIEASV